MKAFTLNTLLLCLGSALCAYAVNAIIVPFEFLSSGMTGLSLVIYHKFKGIPLGIIYFAINVPVFLAGLRFVGLRFMLYTAWGMAIYSVMLSIPVIPLQINDRLLGAALAGGISGTGIAIMLRSYGSAGGSEIISIIMHKLSGITIGTGNIIINVMILIMSLALFPLENIVYTFFIVITSAKVTDTIFHGMSKRMAVMIISSKWNEILSDLQNDDRWRVTLLYGKGGFLGTEQSVLYSVVNKSNLLTLKKLVINKDPNAFIATMEATDVTGVVGGNQPHW